MAALLTTRDKTFMRKQSSALLWGMEVDPDGSPLGAPDTYHGLGYALKTVYNRAATQTKEKDQGGTEHVVGTETAATFEYTVMQRDKLHIDLPKDLDGHYIRFVQELTNSALSTMKQYLVVCAALIEPTLVVDGTDMYVKHKYTCSPNSSGASITLDLSSITDTSFGAGPAAAGSIAVGEYELIVEVAA